MSEHYLYTGLGAGAVGLVIWMVAALYRAIEL